MEDVAEPREGRAAERLGNDLRRAWQYFVAAHIQLATTEPELKPVAKFEPEPFVDAVAITGFDRTSDSAPG